MITVFYDKIINLRRRGYSIRKIAEELDVATVRVYQALKRTEIDEELYAQDDLP